MESVGAEGLVSQGSYSSNKTKVVTGPENETTPHGELSSTPFSLIQLVNCHQCPNYSAMILSSIDCKTPTFQVHYYIGLS